CCCRVSWTSTSVWARSSSDTSPTLAAAAIGNSRFRISFASPSTVAWRATRTNAAERLAVDPTFRMLASRERRETSVALTSTLHWFETDVTKERNYQGLARLNTELVQCSAIGSGCVTFDIDSSESPVHGAQEQSAYNGHFESVCYHPLFVFNPEGDCLAAKLRPGNVHSADGWDEVLLPIIDRYRARAQTVVVRADAAFALPALYEALERRG